MAKLNVVFIASEAAPLVKTGGLADVIGSLPYALKKLNHRVTVVLPFYRRHLKEAGIESMPTPYAADIWADAQQRHVSIRKARVEGLDFLLVEQDDLYDREGVYGPPGGAYDDNLLRYLLFNRVALEAIARLPQKTDVIHCHDWQTGMVPLLLKTQYQHHAKIAQAKTVFTIHNLAYQGVFDADWIHRLGIPSHHFNQDGYEYYNQINCIKAAIEMADTITTVSPSYAEEILTSEYGCGLEGFLQKHLKKLGGIVNGLNVDEWNPLTDAAIDTYYGAGKTTGKKRCKRRLQEICGFEVSANTPLLSIISRLAEQKGIDLLIANIKQWMKRGYQLAILGSGDPKNEAMLLKLARQHPQQLFFYQGFNESLARQIYAGGDIFLMPSRFEPCGLGQLMAMRYGSVPVVRATGGLRDTVVDYQTSKTHATGIHFSRASAADFDQAVEQAIALYRQPKIWSRLRANALRRDSSWDASAREYARLYKKLCA